MLKSHLTRRQFLTGLASAPLLAVSATSAYASLVEPVNYELSETDIPVRDLPDSFDGFRIVQVSDVHHSRIVSIDEVRRVVEVARKARADLVALTGDYTTMYRRYIEPCAEALGTLEAPEGIWAVLGNHDHYTDAQLTTRALEKARIHVLNNANTLIRRGADVLQLAGVDDWSWGKTDWARAFYGMDRKRPSVLLSHQPRVLDFAETQGVSLILSGHTHGGQLSFPLIGAPARFISAEMKYARGLFEKNGTQLYVSRGTGMIGLPVRFGARPEISVLRLRRAP
ncbi:MAG TPA: metallophosphoesterase [Pyrinomonadaceae bacterium]|jgi:predicted MPP superfamily phosphohydrolase|nr:metallophosphoesterase [Pyrinomonadaceae bacterium]